MRKALQLLQSLREQVQSQPSYPAGGGSSGSPLVGCGSGDSATNKDSETAQEDLSVQGSSSQLKVGLGVSFAKSQAV